MHQRMILSFGNLFSVAHFYLIVYVLTPYLATFMRPETTGLPITLGALVTLMVFPFVPKLVQKHGPARLAITFATLEAIVLLVLASSPSPLMAIVLIALSCAASPLIAYQLDLLLEATIAEESSTGRIRTAFLTAGNLSLIFAPLVVGALLDNTDAYWRVFLVAAASLVPFILLLMRNGLPHGEQPQLQNIIEVWGCLLKNEDIRADTLAFATLQFFYHLAPLYIPLYLHNALGIPWGTLGWMFSVMLLPFVLLEYPIGWLADKKFGDQEIMGMGFLIMGASFAAVAFITSQTLIAITLTIIVLTRVGAVMVEATAEGHFFRRVSEKDITTVTLFRMMRPFGALIAPLVGSMILATSDYSVFFFSTGIFIVFFGVASALSIKDIR